MKVSDIYKRLYKFYGPQGWWPGRSRLEIIVGAILTQNTAWRNVEKAIDNMRKAGLLSSPRKIKNVDTKTLAQLVRPAGYYNIKSKRLKNFINFLFSKYNGNLSKVSRQGVEKLRRELLSVSGIGPETCDSILLYAFEKPTFVIDAYTRRVFSRHKFFDERARYDDIQRFFMVRLPKDVKLYNEYHALVVRLGKEFCRKVANCLACPLKVE